MALPVQTLNVSLAGGMNEKTPRELLPAGQNSLVQNGRWLQPGQVETRLGYTTLSTNLFGGTSVATKDAERLLTRNDELCYMNHQGFNAYAPAISKWIRKDDAAEPHLYQDRLNSVIGDASVSFADMAVNSAGVQCVAWQETNNAATVNLWAALYDSNGQLILRSKLQTNGIRPRVVLVGSTFVIVWVSNTVANTLYASTIAVGGTAFSAPSGFITDIQGTGNNAFDVAATSTYFIVAYQNTANDLRVRRYNSSLTLENSNTLPGLNVTLTAVYLDGTDVFVAYHNTAAGGSTDAKKLSADLATTSWTATAIAGATGTVLVAGPHSDTTYFYVVRRGATLAAVEWVRVTKSSGAAGTLHQNRSVEIASKPFTVPDYAESFINIRVARGQNVQEGLVCCALGNGTTSADYRLRPIAKWLTAKVWVQDIGGAPQHVPAVTVTGGRAYIAYTEKGFGPSARGQYVTVSKLDFDARNRWARQEDRDTVLIAGGMLHQYDGELCSEIPFAYYPFPGTPTRSAGGTLPVGTNGLYEYVVVYEWTDAKGRVHRSTPSAPVVNSVALTAGNQTLSVTVPHLTLTSRSDLGSEFRSKAAIVFYRRGPDASAATTFLRLSTTTGQLPDNDPLSATDYTLVDNGTSWVTTDNLPLYTTGGVLENAPASSCRVVAKWDNRIWIGGCENPNSIWYSRELVADEPAYWHENQQVICEEKVTALANFDSALIVFSKDSIYAMQGSGPNDLGQGGTYTGLIKLASEVGCVDWRSICATADGIFFQHHIAGGIYLLDRSLSLSYIGAPIETQVTVNYTTVTSAVAVPDEDEVRFSVTNGSTGRLLVYNTLIKQWMVHKLFDTLELDPRDALLWIGSYTFVRGGSPGRFGVQAQNYRDYDLTPDVEYRIPLEVTTGDISVDGPLGRDRQWRILLFARRGASNSHGLEVSVAYDQSDSYSDTKTWTAAQIAALTSPTHEALEVVAKSRQEARAIRIRVRTLAGTMAPITEAVKLMALGFEFGKEEGLTVLPAAQKR